MNICRLNRSSKVCMKKGPARHTRTPPNSHPEPNTFFQHILSRRNSVPEPILNLKSVMQAGANFKHTLELTSKQQIFVIFIVDYFCKKEFLKILKF